MQFTQLGLDDEIIKAVDEMGFAEATQIQEKSIPLLLDGKDVIGRSNTGTGKTAAFALPAIQHISKSGEKIVQVLILCPTRELAMQANEEILRFSKYMSWVKSCAIYGGASMEKQISALKRGANIVVGTPGRVMDHIERRTLKLGGLKTIILDEADEMLNMGFREDIEEILKSVPEERQTVLFSATMPPAIMAITKKFQKDPVVVKVETAQRTVAAIEQYFYEVPTGRKLDALVLLLSMYEPKLSIIFCNTKKMVDELSEALNNRGFKAAGIHGDMKQMSRTQVMDRFKSGKTSILIATDVAARGIDVDDVDAVFNYDIPQDYEYYIHRIGRTGRAGKTGTAFTLTSGRRQIYEMRDLQRYIKAVIHQKELPTATDIKKKKLDKFADRLDTIIQDGKWEEYMPLLTELVEKGIPLEKIAASLLSMQLGKEIKSIPVFEVVKSSHSSTPKLNKKEAKGSYILLSVGRKQRIAPNFVLGALVETTGLFGKEFGKINIYETYTTVEVPEDKKDDIIRMMNNTKINGNVVKAGSLESEEFSGNHHKKSNSQHNKKYDGKKGRQDKYNKYKRKKY